MPQIEEHVSCQIFTEEASLARQDLADMHPVHVLERIISFVQPGQVSHSQANRLLEITACMLVCSNSQKGM